jgi:hypothetical protein
MQIWNAGGWSEKEIYSATTVREDGGGGKLNLAP